MARRVRRWLLRSTGASFLGVTTLGVVIAVNTASMPSRQIRGVPPAARVEIDPMAAAERLAGAIRIPTVSYSDPAKMDMSVFSALHDYLARAFPLAHEVMEREVVSGGTLFFTWRGERPELDPVLLMAHLDVVPAKERAAEAGGYRAWEHPPFSGHIDGEFIWGRGALDVKCGVTGILEAVEHLAAQGFTPRRTVCIAMGHDEETGGHGGNETLAAMLAQRGVRFEMVLDEGGSITEGIVPEIEAPVALVGIAEKGYLSVRLTAQGPGGHSSMPPDQTPVGIIGAAVARLEANQLPARLDGATREMFNFLSPEMPLFHRIMFANTWLFEPLIVDELTRSPAVASTVRTTTAVTMVEGGIKDNVIPPQASAVVNFRILPGQTTAEVMDHARRAIADDRVRIEPLSVLMSESTGVSPTDSEAFRLLQRLIAEGEPRAVVAPFLVVGTTDSRHYEPLSPNVFRFMPVRYTPEDLPRLHGDNERISVENYAEIVDFYVRLIRGV